MLRRLLLLSALLSPALVLAQDAPDALQSGPPRGALLTQAFDAFTLNGDIGKGRYHCLVCEFGLRPVVLVFAQEHPEGQDKALDDLLQRLDKAVARDQDGYLCASVIFLSPAARSSATESKEKPVTKAAELVQQAKDRRDLLARLQPLADKLKHVSVAIYPEPGPEGYQLSPKADVTVLLYLKHKVSDRFAFPKGGLTDKAAAEIVDKANELIGKASKTLPPVKKGKEQPKDKGKGKTAQAGSRRLFLQLDLLVEALSTSFHRYRHCLADLVLFEQVEQLAG
jgi:hypothetical protein